MELYISTAKPRMALTAALRVSDYVKITWCWLKQLENFRKFSRCWNLAIDVLSNHLKK